MRCSSSLDVPGALQAIDHLVGAEPRHVHRAVGDESLEHRRDIVDAVTLKDVLDRGTGASPR